MLAELSGGSQGQQSLVRSSGNSQVPPHGTATCSGWKTRGMLNMTETPGRGDTKSPRSVEERVGHAGVWDPTAFVHASIQGGHFGLQSYPPPRIALGFSPPQSFVTQPGASLLCQGSAKGSHHHQAPPAVTTLGSKSTRALRDAGEN